MNGKWTWVRLIRSGLGEGCWGSKGSFLVETRKGGGQPGRGWVGQCPGTAWWGSGRECYGASGYKKGCEAGVLR